MIQSVTSVFTPIANRFPSRAAVHTFLGSRRVHFSLVGIAVLGLVTLAVRRVFQLVAELHDTKTRLAELKNTEVKQLKSDLKEEKELNRQLAELKNTDVKQLKSDLKEEKELNRQLWVLVVQAMKRYDEVKDQNLDLSLSLLEVGELSRDMDSSHRLTLSPIHCSSPD